MRPNIRLFLVNYITLTNSVNKTIIFLNMYAKSWNSSFEPTRQTGCFKELLVV